MSADVPGRGTGDQRPRHHQEARFASFDRLLVRRCRRPVVTVCGDSGFEPGATSPAALPFPAGATAPELDPRTPGRGYRPLRPALSLHLLCHRPPGPASRHQRHRRDASRRAAVDQRAGGDGDLAVHRPDAAGDGAACHHLRRILHQLERQQYSQHGEPDAGRPLRHQDLLPAEREHRPGDQPDRVGDEHRQGLDADRHPAAGRGAVQRHQRAGAAAQPDLGHAERAAALRLRPVPDAPSPGADPRHHPADALRRPLSRDHGRPRPRQAARLRHHPRRRGQRGQRPVADPARGRRQAGHAAVHRPSERHGADARRAGGRADPPERRDHGVPA